MAKSVVDLCIKKRAHSTSSAKLGFFGRWPQTGHEAHIGGFFLFVQALHPSLKILKNKKKFWTLFYLLITENMSEMGLRYSILVLANKALHLMQYQ